MLNWTRLDWKTILNVTLNGTCNWHRKTTCLILIQMSATTFQGKKQAKNKCQVLGADWFYFVQNQTVVNTFSYLKFQHGTYKVWSNNITHGPFIIWSFSQVSSVCFKAEKMSWLADSKIRSDPSTEYVHRQM